MSTTTPLPLSGKFVLVTGAARTAARTRTNAPSVLREAATAYKVDTDGIAQKGKAEFAAKAKAKKETKLSRCS
jgi:ParB family chromosome partitioning protein